MLKASILISLFKICIFLVILQSALLLVHVVPTRGVWLCGCSGHGEGSPAFSGELLLQGMLASPTHLWPKVKAVHTCSSICLQSAWAWEEGTVTAPLGTSHSLLGPQHPSYTALLTPSLPVAVSARPGPHSPAESLGWLCHLPVCQGSPSRDSRAWLMFRCLGGFPGVMPTLKGRWRLCAREPTPRSHPQARHSECT